MVVREKKLYKKRQEELSAEEEFSTTEEEKPSKKRSQDPSEMLPTRKKGKVVEFSDIAWGEEVRPVSEERIEFLRSGPDLSTPRPARHTIVFTLKGGYLVVAELVSFILK